MNTWPALSEPIDPLDNFLIAKAMSANTRDGKVQPFDEARTYAREQGAPDPQGVTQ